MTMTILGSTLALLLGVSAFAEEPVLALQEIKCVRGADPKNAMSDPSDLTCSGKVRNVSTRSVETASVKVALFGAGGRELEKDGVRIDTLPLPPGKQSSFELVIYFAPDGVKQYSVQFKTFTDEPIAAAAADGSSLPKKFKYSGT